MRTRKLLAACLGAAAGFLVAGGPANAAVLEIGEAATPATPSCPDSPCQAVSRTTAFQSHVGEQRGLFKAKKRGRVVAWSVTLGNPTDEQRAFFDERLGGKATAALTIMRWDKPRRTWLVVSQTPLEDLEPYFGTTAQFPLRESLFVRKGYRIAITVPTWAPILSLNHATETVWFASRRNRPVERCMDTERQTARTDAGDTTRFLCKYRTARLTYGATMVTYPAPAARDKS